MFIVSLNYIAPITEVEKHLEAHIEYLKKHYDLKHFLASGRKVPRTGGVILMDLETREALDQIVSEDPFHINKVASYEITEFIPTMTHPQLDPFRVQI